MGSANEEEEHDGSRGACRAAGEGVAGLIAVGNKKCDDVVDAAEEEEGGPCAPDEDESVCVSRSAFSWCRGEGCLGPPLAPAEADKGVSDEENDADVGRVGRLHGCFVDVDDEIAAADAIDLFIAVDDTAATGATADDDGADGADGDDDDGDGGDDIPYTMGSERTRTSNAIREGAGTGFHVITWDVER